MHLSLLASVGFAALLCGAAPALAVATAPTPGAWQSFGVLAGSAVTNTGPTIIIGDLGVSPGTAVTGFPPGIVSAPGTIYSGPGPAATGQTALTTAYNELAGQTCDFDLTGSNLGSVGTLTTGVYCFSTSAQLTGTLHLTGNASDIFIFKIGSTLTTASGSSVVLEGTAQACNVFWQIGTSATLGTNTAFVGNILALASITMNTGATLDGRALARNGAVTLDSNTTDASVCGSPPVPAPPPNVGLFKVFNPATIPVNNVSTLTITLTNVAGALTPATITSFIDNLPPGMTIANPTNAGTDCPGPPPPTVGAVIGDNKVTLTGGQIPGGTTTTPGFCTVTVNVTTTTTGSFKNELGTGILVTDQGSNEAGPSVVLNAVVLPVTGVPTLSEWGMIIFMVLVGLMSIYYLRRQKAKA